jgi:acyl-CoA thioester hydrolase
MAEKMPALFTWTVRVYYEDTDAGGIVFYANYLKFFERARTEWLRAAGVDQQALIERDGAAFVVKQRQHRLPRAGPPRRRIDPDAHHRKARPRLGPVRPESVWKGDLLLVEASVKVGCVDLVTVRPRSLPDDVADKMRAA